MKKTAPYIAAIMSRDTRKYRPTDDDFFEASPRMINYQANTMYQRTTTRTQRRQRWRSSRYHKLHDVGFLEASPRMINYQANTMY